jgi:hypothetical protein
MNHTQVDPHRVPANRSQVLLRQNMAVLREDRGDRICAESSPPSHPRLSEGFLQSPVLPPAFWE